MHDEDLFTTYPELYSRDDKFRNLIPFKTIAELGFKSPIDAASNNYTCVRQYSGRGHSPTPSLWVPNLFLPTINQMVSEIEDHRQKKQKLADEKLQASNKLLAINEIAYISGWSKKSVEEAVSQELLQEFSRNPKNPINRFVLCNSPQWRGQKPNPNDLFYTVEYSKISAISKSLCEFLLLNDHDSYLKELEQQLQLHLQKASDICAQWSPSKPAWFLDEHLKNWSILAANRDVAEHPLLSLQALNKISKRPIKTVFCGKNVSAKINSITSAKLLWVSNEVFDLPTEIIISELLSKYLFSRIDSALQAFYDKNEFNQECENNEFTSEEWGAFLKTAFLHVLGDSFSTEKTILAAQSQLSKVLAKRHLTLAARRCFKELPGSLKEFYPLARSLQREITFVYGPTNSGKTHHALDALKIARTGVYLGPLRLLALEIFDRLNDAEIPTSLVTGELVQDIPGATHTSSTIEMLNLGRKVDVAVIDEVQMVGDPERGSAWLQAILGTPARHLILLGSKNALSAVRMLASLTNEPLREIELTRLNELKVSQQPIQLKHAPKGAALIVFSRQAVLNLANHMRTKYDRKVSVIYGALSPEVRAEQARQFRTGETDILVSTDAIGMGLNLPISTGIFTGKKKGNG